jgi:hypothetical protein
MGAKNKKLKKIPKISGYEINLAGDKRYSHKFLDTCPRLCNMLHMVLLPGKDKKTVRITNI